MPRLPNPPGTRIPSYAAQARCGGFRGIDFLRFDPLEDGFVLVRQAAVQQRFAQTFVGVFELHVFSHYRDAHFACRMVQAMHQVQPRLHVGRFFDQLEVLQNLGVQPFSRKLHGNGIDGVHVLHGNDAGFGDVAEQRDFLFQLFGNVAVAAAQQNVRLDSDAQHFFDAVLRGLGFQLAGRGDEGHEGDVHEQSIFEPELEAHLADGFEEGKGLDVADGAADFDDDHVHAFGDFFDGGFDFVGDVRDDLDGFSEVIAAALLGEDGFVDAAGGPVIVAGKFGVSEALVVAEVEVGFGAVFGDEDFAVLKRAHGAGIHVEVRVAFLQGDFKAATFEETSDGGGSYALAQ